MKKTVTFTDEKLKLMEKALDVAIPASIGFGPRPKTQELLRLREEIWGQLYGTEATDVEGV